MIGLALVPSVAAAQSSADLQRALEESLAGQPASPGMAAAVDRGRFHWAGATGVLDRASGSPLRPNDGYRIASVTKTFTAAAILRLVEQGKVRLGASIERYLPRPYLRLLRADGYSTRAITVAMLLRHTAGLFEYGSSPEYGAAVTSDPGHRWSRIEQVRFAMRHGDPVSRPGRSFHYADTGYILLGQIIESVTGMRQAPAYRALLRFRRIGLRATYFESLERKPRGAGRQAHQYFGDLDTFGVIDPSHDLYGGGGLVSTASEVNRFFRALFAGRVIGGRLLRVMKAARPGGYGMGLYRLEGTSAGTCFGHDGFWGAFTLYCPRRDTAVSVTVNAAPPVAPRPTAYRLLDLT